MKKPKFLTLVGTRPEIIRLSRLIALLNESTEHVLVHTGQNYDSNLSDVFFEDLGILKPNHYLDVDTSTLGSVLADTLKRFEKVLLEERPDAVLILGDTNSAIAAIIAKRMHIPVYHMEAGNRSFDENVPEETNRRMVDHVADFNLAYTEHARRNLLNEGLKPRQIVVTGSPLKEVLDFYGPKIAASTILESLKLSKGKYFLVSAHRQENVDSQERLITLLSTLALVRDRWKFPIHVTTHPRTRNRIANLGQEFDTHGIIFHEPFNYSDYVTLQQNAFCTLSDSGTISEESAILGFPAVTIRDSMERPEALEMGSIIMTGVEAKQVMFGIESATSAQKKAIPVEYLYSNFSERVLHFVSSTYWLHKSWLGLKS